MSTMKHTNKTDEPKEISRNWATILYPESAKENWFEILEKQGIQTAISPIHDKDVTDDGEPKKLPEKKNRNFPPSIFHVEHLGGIFNVSRETLVYTFLIKFIHAGVTVSSSTKYQIEQLSFYAHELFGECLTYDDIVTLMIHYFYVGLGLREKPTGDIKDTFI